MTGSIGDRGDMWGRESRMPTACRKMRLPFTEMVRNVKGTSLGGDATSAVLDMLNLRGSHKTFEWDIKSGVLGRGLVQRYIHISKSHGIGRDRSMFFLISWNKYTEKILSPHCSVSSMNHFNKTHLFCNNIYLNLTFITLLRNFTLHCLSPIFSFIFSLLVGCEYENEITGTHLCVNYGRDFLKYCSLLLLSFSRKRHY